MKTARSLLPWLLFLGLLSVVPACSSNSDGDTNPAVDAGLDGDASMDAMIDEDAPSQTDVIVTDTPADTQPDSETGTLPSTCIFPENADPTGTDTWNDTLGTATVSVTDRSACHRDYTLATTASLRHPSDHPNPRNIKELADWPTLRTGHDMVDALYALTLEEVRENSVDAIHDYGFNNGQSVGCGTGGCFETGRLWNYVWTRDTSYSVDLGLAAMDPKRSLNSLEFKLSERREGGDLQIVQDTGSGGSYPVSTDRVAWAVGAWELLRQLQGSERIAFRDRTFEALKNTIEHDRKVVYDPSDGLYRGEQSFMDWREQTYPAWTATDVVQVGVSKSLSTNLLHFRAMQLASEIAKEVGDTSAQNRYQSFANDLRSAIQDRLWLEHEGLFSTYIPTTLDPAAVRRYELLGSAFAVIFGVASPAQASRILANYPHYGPGAPVAWPQQQHTPIYHNRGEWPFVTAYWLRAAKVANNDAVADRMVHALIRGTAINLSNMENFEAASGAAWFEDGNASGPVVNSERQLWSVAGFLSMVHHTLFGLEAQDQGLKVEPFIPASLRKGLFAGTDSLVLNDYPYQGHPISVVIHLPKDAGSGVLSIASLKLNGTLLTKNIIDSSMLASQNRIDVQLATGTGPNADIQAVSTSDWKSIFGPRTPSITNVVAETGGIRLTLATEEPSDVTLRIYRDGQMVADGLMGTTTSWKDENVDPSGPRSPCYVVEASFPTTGNHSQHSLPSCYWGPSGARIKDIPASEFVNVGGSPSNNHGRFHYEQWGNETDTLTVNQFTATQTGPHLISLSFGNGAGPINTGITCAVKEVVVQDTATNEVVGSGIVMMPHLAAWDRWSESSFAPVTLTAGKTYRLVVKGGGHAINMSSFAHFEAYTGGLGGSSGVYGHVNISNLRILAL